MSGSRPILLAMLLAVFGCAQQPPAGPAPVPADEERAVEPEDAERPDEPADPADAAEAPRMDRFPPALLAGAEVEDILVRPEVIELRVGETMDLSEMEIVPVGLGGEPVQGVEPLTFLDDRVAVVRDGVLTARAEGRTELVVGIRAAPEDPADDPEVRVFDVPVVVRGQPVASVRIDEPERAFYTGTTIPLSAEALTGEGERRRRTDLAWESRDPDVATVSERGWVRAVRPGSATIAATSEGVTGSVEIEVRENPVHRIELTPSTETARTGDVVRFEARPLDEAGALVDDVALTYTVGGGEARDEVGASVWADGAFVAAEPGAYTVVAAAGPVSAEALVEVRPRGVRGRVERVGQGLVSHAPTSDLWVFRGVDGRDYAYHGTHAGGQKMFTWDVTDPANPVLTDSVVVDARVVNDVKVNEDASLAVITREGASDRRNGMVILDLADPAHPEVLSEFTQNLTGGVHNTFIAGDLVYAIHDGDLDVHIVDISDPQRPRHVGEWGIDRPGKYLHDIWIADGLAYVSYWDDGLFILDVGDGRWGGTPTEPVEVSSLAYPEGQTHVAFPYTNADGHSYVFVGDEIFGCDECIARSGTHVDGPRGFVHVLDLEDPENPREVGRYEVPEAGVHNLWVEDDLLYAAYYQGGLRVVDVSGELRGDLYRQGREIAWYPTGHPEGLEPNAPLAWGPQPYRGNIYVSDLNSGLWVLRLVPGEGDLR